MSPATTVVFVIAHTIVCFLGGYFLGSIVGHFHGKHEENENKDNSLDYRIEMNERMIEDLTMKNQDLQCRLSIAHDENIQLSAELSTWKTYIKNMCADLEALIEPEKKPKPTTEETNGGNST